MLKILWVLPLFLISGCHDWDKDYAACQADGRCSGGAPDSGNFAGLTWTPNKGEFGEVPVMGVGPLTFKVRNTGNTALTNLKIRFAAIGSASEFSLPDSDGAGHACDRAELALGDECDVRVDFEPNDLLAKTARLIAKTDQGETALLLTGKGSLGNDFLVTVGSNTGERVSISYTDPRFGQVVRNCVLQACAYRLSAPSMVVADLGTDGRERLFAWAADCDGETGQTCTRALTTSTKSLTIGVSFGEPVRTIVEPSNATAALTMVPPNRPCTGDCTNGALPGSTVMINAVPTGDWLFAGFDGCTAASGSANCPLKIVDGGATVTGHFVQRPRAFVTSTRFNPMDYLPSNEMAVDTFCRLHALDAGLLQPDGGEYVWTAWALVSGKPPRQRLGGSGWVRPDGRPFFDGDEQQTRYPPVLDEHGDDLRDGGKGTIALLGSDFNADGGCTAGSGTWFPGEASSHWPLWDSDKSPGITPVSCTTPAHVLCFQRPLVEAVPRPPDPLVRGANKLLFVTKQAISADVGLSGFNARCSEEADGGKFHAVVQGAMLVAHDAGYVRADDVLLFPTQDALQQLPLAPIALESNGQRAAPSVVWTGAPGANCTDWKSDAGNTLVGSPLRSTLEWTNAFPDQCSGQARLYCVED